MKSPWKKFQEGREFYSPENNEEKNFAELTLIFDPNEKWQKCIHPIEKKTVRCGVHCARIPFGRSTPPPSPSQQSDVLFVFGRKI